MYFTLSMVVFMALSAAASAANSVVAFRNDNRDAAWAWGVSTMFALALFVFNLGDLLKYMG